MSDYDAHDYTNSTWTDISIHESTFPVEHTLIVDGRALIQDRDILQELDEMRVRN